jgi:3',5'-cyclic AMP phosphodiesterase CpdA
MKRTILHASDLHFGEAHAPDRAEALLEAVRRARPTVVAVSGDLTRRARSHEFREARRFLDRIDRPLVVVPGNHDVPLWNPVARFLSPRARWQSHLGDLPSRFVDEGLALQGVDTTRRFTVSSGRVDEHDLREIEGFCALAPSVCKVIVAHHPFVIPPGTRGHRSPVSGAADALAFFDSCGVDAVLTGHLHSAHVGSSKELFPGLSRSIVLVHAGTATTLRGRGEEREKNSLNLVEVGPEAIEVTHLLYGEDGFEAGEKKTFPRHGARAEDSRREQALPGETGPSPTYS